MHQQRFTLLLMVAARTFDQGDPFAQGPAIAMQNTLAQIDSIRPGRCIAKGACAAATQTSTRKRPVQGHAHGGHFPSDVCDGQKMGSDILGRRSCLQPVPRPRATDAISLTHMPTG
jgi:hypothetical protein